ncbi:MAG: TIGR03986 family CRISPR-associated RAMP protein, partial [Gammaproteobacteria bacterium]|nr:TIGR03986 family CRISPR-associated RAMP protein [Gammaproteobacteria bacterium]
MLHAPYNFVPLSGWIYHPSWAKAISHDLPLQGGLNGTLQIELTAHTPILVGGRGRKATKDREGSVEFVRLPDGNFAIPGSTLKGMARSIIEIAGFGKMRQVDDRWLSFRDLNLPAYRENLTTEVERKTYRPLAESGWLSFTGTKWEIVPCQHARVEQSVLIERAQKQGIQGAEDIRYRKTANSAHQKYEIWGDNLETDFTLEPAKPHTHAAGIRLEYARVTNLGAGSHHGRIVFTGQPSDNDGKPRRKHMEFIFHGDGQPEDVDDGVIRAFLHIHENGKEWQARWREAIQRGDRVPVFFLRDDHRRIASLGLAQMYRLPYSYSIGQTIDHSHPDHRSEYFHDLPELLFGVVNQPPEENQQKPAPNLKGRISFGLARHMGEPEEQRELPTTILGAPKPSYFPAYIRQEGERVQSHKTYLNKDAEVHGWKRYPVRPRAERQQPTREQAENKKVQVRLNPLAAGASFVATVRFHNLLPQELGALVWVLEWGGDAGKRHAIGMGKSMGFGQTSIRITAGQYRENGPHLLTEDGWQPVDGERLTQWRARFET